MSKDELNKLSGIISDLAIEVHRNLGPGLLESVYEICLFDEVICKGIKAERQVIIPIIYKGKTLPKEFCIDLFIEKEIIVEIKTVEKILPIHEAQLLTYLKLTNKKLELYQLYHNKTSIFSYIIDFFTSEGIANVCDDTTTTPADVGSNILEYGRLSELTRDLQYVNNVVILDVIGKR